MPELIKGGRLTKTVFAEGIGLIAARWNREIDANVSAVMAEWLADHQCTADEFITGVKRAVAEDEWPPNAKRILELARPVAGAEARAGEIFDGILQLRKYHPGFGSRVALNDVEVKYGEAAMRAVVAVGGASRFTQMTDESRPFIQKDFVKAFIAFDAEINSRATTSMMLDRREQGRLLAAGES
jgi:hypothetical protein